MTLKVHYCPSWNGDWRLAASPDDPKTTRLSVERPTPNELRQLRLLAPVFFAKGWLTSESVSLLKNAADHVILHAPVSEVGPLVVSTLQPGPTILTAVRFEDGKIEVAETNSPEPPAPPTPAAVAEESPAPPPPPPPPAAPSPEAVALAKRPDAKVAATVKRPTPCCPDCYVDAVRPATEVLLSFLTAAQHETWARERYVIVHGGVTRHRYLIAHRHSPRAAAQRRITLDLDDRVILHFHDWTIPPEEEVLGAMLILRHREPWLRNEATCLGNHTDKLKNPFGGYMDGVVDSMWTQDVGRFVGRALAGLS